MTEKAYPLHWPVGWKRTPSYQRKPANFGTVKQSGTNSWKSRSKLTLHEATNRLIAELDRLGARNEILSTNLELRLDGLPRSGQRMPEDCGAAVYFNLLGKQQVLACDKWDRVEDNIAALAAHIDAIRRQERYGVGSLEQAFRGYQALPAPMTGQRPWYDVLGVDPDAPLEEVKKAYKAKALKAHPDNGGSDAEMSAINAAMDEARKEKEQ